MKIVRTKEGTRCCDWCSTPLLPTEVMKQIKGIKIFGIYINIFRVTTGQSDVCPSCITRDQNELSLMKYHSFPEKFPLKKEDVERLEFEHKIESDRKMEYIKRHRYGY